MGPDALIATAGRVPGCENLLECFPEFGVEDRVDNRIEGRVRIPEPGQDLEREICGWNILLPRCNVVL